MALPSRRTILAVLEKVPLEVRINEHLFRHVNQSLIRETDRLCIFLFDEMDIQANLYYHKSADRIFDYADFRSEDNRVSQLPTRH